jgi:hypothetical protein
MVDTANLKILYLSSRNYSVEPIYSRMEELYAVTYKEYSKQSKLTTQNLRKINIPETIMKSKICIKTVTEHRLNKKAL